MAIALIVGPANAGKAELLMEDVRRHLARGAAPMLVVPTRADVEHYARELAGDGAALGVRVEVFAGLAREIVMRAGLARAPLQGLARRQLIAALAAARGTEATPGLLDALGELFAELQARRVAPARLAGALSSWREREGEDPRAQWLGVLYGEYRRALERIGRMDYEQRLASALDALREQPRLWGETPVLLYGFDDLTALELDTIQTLGRQPDSEVTVSLAYEAGRVAFAGRARTFQELAPLAREVRTLEPRSEHYAAASRAALSHLERSLFEADAARRGADGALRLLEGGGERAELELVAGELRALLDAGLQPEETAVMTRAGAAGRALLAEVFQTAGVPIAVVAHEPLSDTALGAAVIGLLRCVPASDAAHEGRLADLLAWLRAPGLLEWPLLADRLELQARREGIADAAGARVLWERENWPLQSIDRLQQAAERGPVALIDRVSRELARIFAAPARGSAELLEGAEDEHARAFACATGALAELKELARAAPAMAPAQPWALAQALATVSVPGRDRSGPGRVAILDPLALRARRVRALFVCGLQEGVFPAPARAHPLLSEEDRAGLAMASGLLLEREQDPLARERYLFYAAVSRPQELLVLSWHTADDDGEPQARSLFVEDVCDLFDEDLIERRVRRGLGEVEEAPPQRALIAEEDRLSIRDERLLEDLGARIWSASSLERWLGCPVAWFVDRMLAPEDFAPEAEPLAQGGLAHEALREVLEGLRAQTGSARVRPDSLMLAGRLLAAALEHLESERPLSVSPERRVAIARRLRSDLERYLAHAAASPGLEPSELELGFGFSAEDSRGEGATLEPLVLDGGVRVRGRIDRVDVNAAGEAVVIDYKSSRATPAARWRADGNLQLALYMLAVEQLLGRSVRGGLYQPLSGDLQARGALEREAGIELDAVRTDLLEHDELAELLDWARETARAAAAEAAQGRLQPRPGTCAYRGGCMYPSICRWEA